MRDDAVYLGHIRTAIERIADYTADGVDAFLSDPKTQDAVVRNLETIGEAVKNISGSLKAKHARVPWRLIAGMRDKLIHHYFGVDVRLIWDVVAHDLPQLNAHIQDILASLPDEGEGGSAAT
ncbi:MAG: DUF86 domain-containing protein [Candidatus Brocadiae bacterium]|nr:DUF86 domain-containing protein [Candidatus Brocadiia bacterium]